MFHEKRITLLLGRVLLSLSYSNLFNCIALKLISNRPAESVKAMNISKIFKLSIYLKQFEAQ